MRAKHLQEKNSQVHGAREDQSHMWQAFRQGRCLVATSSGSSVAASALTASCGLVYMCLTGDAWINAAFATTAPVANTNGTDSFLLPANTPFCMAGDIGSGVVAIRATTVATISMMEAKRG